MDRVVIAHTSLGSGLLFKSMSGREILSGCYEFNIELLSTDNSIDIKGLLGQPLTLELRPNPFTTRYLSGIVTRMDFVGHEPHLEQYYVYRATVRPNLWYLTQNYGFRIWENKSVKEIITALLGEFNITFEDKLSGTYRVWEYCVQYQESIFEFISRLMEHEGMYFYFTHQMDSQTLVLADSPTAHEPFTGYSTIEYHQASSGLYVNEESIDTWHVTESISPSMYRHDDYNYLKSDADLSSTGQISQSQAGNTATRTEWPGHYAEPADGTQYTKIRQQEYVALQAKNYGEGDAFGLAPGYTFTLSKAPRASDEGKEFLITEVTYTLTENSYATNDEDTNEHRFVFSVIPATVNYRSQRVTSWPRTNGPQTAMVVKDPGTGDETISTDQYGRVKVKFLWYKPENEQELYSCWLRVSSAWAGNQYGSYQVPRVGEEVIVDFINGDPHAPLIIGRVFNNLHTLPIAVTSSDGTEAVAGEWSETKSGIWSRSKGSTEVTNGSYLYFDDAEGEETLDLHSQKNLNVSAKDNVKLYSASTSDEAIKIWSPGKIEITSDDTVSVTAPTTNHTSRGSYWVTTGASFSATGIGLSVNGLNGTINSISSVTATTSDFGIKGVAMGYTYLSRTKTIVDYKSDTKRFTQVPFYQIRTMLMSINSGAMPAEGESSALTEIQSKIKDLKDKQAYRKDKTKLDKKDARKKDSDAETKFKDEGGQATKPESPPAEPEPGPAGPK